MNKIKIFSATTLILSLSIGIFTACKKDEQIRETTTVTTTEVSTTEYNGYSYPELIFTEENQISYTHIAPPVPTRKPKVTKASTKAAVSDSVLTTAKNGHNDKISEESNGLNILSKTTPVIKGNNASIILTGTPGAEYTVEFYKTATQKAAYSGLGTAKADSNGIVIWTFTIESDCEIGDRKVIIREKNSDKYIQTSITVI